MTCGMPLPRAAGAHCRTSSHDVPKASGVSTKASHGVCVSQVKLTCSAQPNTFS